MIIHRLDTPIVLAPLAGGPSTPELAAAVSNAGALGFLAAGYLSADQLAERIAAARSLTTRPLAVNVFAPGEGPSDHAAYEEYVERLRRWTGDQQLPVGEPRFSDDDWDAKLALLVSEPVDAVSFTFGLPARDVVERLRRAGSEVWVTITTPEEASLAEQGGADVLVVQGLEAGGHRGSFADEPGLSGYGLLPLLSLVGAASSLPMVASGGIATGGAVAAVLCAGARAAQLGTAFLLAAEAGTSAAHRAAIAGDARTTLTRAFTGRLARGIHNRFIAEHESQAPIAYPEIHYVTAPMRRHARERGDAELINLWAGEAHALARELPAAEIVRWLSDDARTALASASARYDNQSR
jgi:nitronate monooxygenase